MSEYAISQIEVFVDGKKIASLPQGVLVIEVGEISVTIDEAILNEENLQLLSSINDKEHKEFSIKGKADDRTFTIDDAFIQHLNLVGDKNKKLKLKNLRFMGLHGSWTAQGET